MGGALQVMRWMEQCAYIAASRIGRSGHLLTGSLDSVAFAQPTRVGDIIYITAQVRAPACHSFFWRLGASTRKSACLDAYTWQPWLRDIQDHLGPLP